MNALALETIHRLTKICQEENGMFHKMFNKMLPVFPSQKYSLRMTTFKDWEGNLKLGLVSVLSITSSSNRCRTRLRCEHSL